MIERWVLTLLCCAAFAPAVALASRIGPPKPAQKLLPSDRKRTRVVDINRSGFSYSIRMRSEVDGFMTRDPIGYAAFRQGWQPNLFVRLENVGETDVVNPWILVNGRRDWRTIQAIVREATRGYTTDADKARAIWEFTRHHRFHATTWDNENNDAVKVFNVYGYTLCGNDANVIADLWRAAGLKTRRGYPIGHCVSEAFYRGAYHLLDGDEHCIYLLRDNKTIASEAQVVRDHDLIKRTHTYGILRPDSRGRDEFSASLFVYEGERKGERGGRTKHKMDFTLRPGESLEWRWDHVGKQYSGGADLKGKKWRRDGQGDLRAWGRVAYAKLCNGKLRYRPDLSKPISRRGIQRADNLADALPGLRPAAPDKPCRVVWRIASPYVIVGGQVKIKGRRAAQDDVVSVALSRRGKKWETLWTAEKTGAFEKTLTFDEKLSPRRRPQYEYWLRVELRGAGAGLEAIAFDTDVQMAPLSLPELRAGENAVRYVDESPGPRRVRVTHAWVERTAWRRPPAPKGLKPCADEAVVGTQVRLSWERPAWPVRIADYQVQLSEFPDMRWVLSPNFDKLLSKTAFRKQLGDAKAKRVEWRAPYVGLLNPGQTYYWRVRARDANLVWGPWSEPAAFRCDAPGVPLNVRAAADAAKGEIVLTWDANPAGAAPVAYKVYASNEKGFTPSDTEYLVRMGRGFCSSMEEFEAKKKYRQYVKTPANLMATTRERRLVVVGPRVRGPNANKAYYRVVAVDARGVESGCSDYAEAPRPFIYTRPDSTAVVGREWTYEPASLYSIGDLRCRRSKRSSYNAAFWDKETLAWSLASAPRWLRIDRASGRVRGVPPAAAVGEHKIVLRVTNNKGKSAKQKFVLRVSARP